MLPIDKLKVERVEGRNDGSHIYLHLEANSVVWMACGDSAYLLRLLVKKLGYGYLCGYSDRLQMPCVLIDADVASLYPSMLLNFDCYPKHLGAIFKETYEDIRLRRLAAKKAKELTRAKNNAEKEFQFRFL